MKTSLAKLFAQRFSEQARDAGEAESVLMEPMAIEKNNKGNFDIHLLSSAVDQWRRGEWRALTQIDLTAVEENPDKATLALLVASAWQQLCNQDAARNAIALAKTWRCDKKLLAAILISGVHKTLGRAAAINRNQTGAQLHFDHALNGLLETEEKKADWIGDEIASLNLSHLEFPVATYSREDAPSKVAADIGMSSKKNTPIFIHSLWRAGSTYFFEVFRRETKAYWAYQEPLHEVMLRAQNEPEILTQFTSDSMPGLRHPTLDQPYFWETMRVHENWKGLFKKSIVLDDYFGCACPADTRDYITSLIKAAPRRAVLQECRSSSRIRYLKGELGGVHLYLWRNPRAQWWSFKISDYFNGAIQVILGSPGAPAVLHALRKEIGYRDFHHDEFQVELSFFEMRPLSPENSYLAFYVIWLLSLAHARANADLLINVDRVSNSLFYRSAIVDMLGNLGIDNIHLDDCAMPQIYLSKMDRDFFENIEKRAHALFEQDGNYDALLQFVYAAAEESLSIKIPDDPDSLKRDLQRAREAVLHRETTQSKSTSYLHNQITELQSLIP